MGPPKSAVHLLLHAASTQPFSGHLATLGRQHVYLSESELRQLAHRNSVSLKSTQITLHRDPELRRKGFLSDDSLYALLGFDQSTRIDHSNYEAAEVQLDLNTIQTPDHLLNQFDVVLDSRTVEHIFELPGALAHCLNMTRVGGRIIHLTPSSNAVNHGFYSVSPTLYADFYTASGCTIETLYLCRIPKGFERREWQVYDCGQSDRDWGPIGGLAGNAWFTFCIVRKRENSEPRVPQQSQYESTWRSALQDRLATDGGGKPSDTEELSSSKSDKLLNLTQAYPRVHRAAAVSIRCWRNMLKYRRELRRRQNPYPWVGRF